MRPVIDKDMKSRFFSNGGIRKAVAVIRYQLFVVRFYPITINQEPTTYHKTSYSLDCPNKSGNDNWRVLDTGATGFH
jgi:hypothetical protein